MKLKMISFLLLAFSAMCFAQTKLQLHPLFNDNMVLQQKAKVAIWGKAKPKSKIEIKTNWGISSKAITSKDSVWKAFLQTPKAGGPYTLEIKSGNQKRILNNILVGEVWICSGQSNMEMPLKGFLPKEPVYNSEEEIQNADYPNIRLFTVKTIASLDLKTDCVGKWDECTPTSAGNFSAVGYFFAKKLYDELKIPIGIIHSSWGGTPAEAWTSKKYLSAFSEFTPTLKSIDENVAAKENLRLWLGKFPSVQVSDYNRNDLWNSIDLHDSELCKSKYDDSNWPSMNLPINWEKTSLWQFNGFIWFRKNIELPEIWIGKEITVELGAIDDYDVTYINGIRIGATEELKKWKDNRVYKVKAEVNDNKILTLAVRVHDSGGVGGGIYGGGFKMRLINADSGEEIPLGGDWKYMPIAELFEMKYFLFADRLEEVKLRPKLEYFYDQRTPTALYNGMIAPLTNFSIKGVIWYQGESNTPNPYLYEKLFPALINNWRESWGYIFPFYFVQIAPYRHGGKFGSEYLRDAQRKSLSVPNTGMAVTLDLGDSVTVHPGNKKPVGDRLALWALANQYGKQPVFSGPLYNSMKINGNKVEIIFDYTGSGLEIRNSEKGNHFEIAGEDKVFKPAVVKIEGTKLLVWSNEILNPCAVRYAWRNLVNPVLYNKDGLPASSFRTDSW